MASKVFNPHAYQAWAIEKMVNNPAYGLFMRMGLGKTATTLAAITELKYNRFLTRKTLVIAPLRVAQNTWQTEPKEWAQFENLKVIPLLGPRRVREAAIKQEGDIYIVNRENVVWLVEATKKTGWPFDCVIVDESSNFKDPSTKRFRALKKVRRQIERLYILTGTPAPKGYLGLWAQIYLLDSGARLGNTFGGFRERYFTPDQRGADRVYSWKLRPGAAGAIDEKIADICISMKAEDYLDVPELVKNIVPVTLDRKARAAYDEMEKEMLLQVDSAEIDAATRATLSGKLLQLANGAVYDDERRVHVLHDAKLNALMDLIDAAQGEPVLVFYNYKHDRERILKRLEGTGLTVSELKRPEDITAWNAGKTDVLITHPASTAYGLNLQHGGRNIIWFGLTWQTELYDQAIARLYRQGQTRAVVVNHLVAVGTRDEDVIQAINGDMDTQNALMDSLKERVKRIQA